MARFQVYQLGSGLALDVQTNLLDALHTRVVVPLFPEVDVNRLVHRLNPSFQIGDTTVVMMTEFLAAVPVMDLGIKVADLTHHADTITAATDFLFQGF
jgi:toxin CcdB